MTHSTLMTNCSGAWYVHVLRNRSGVVRVTKLFKHMQHAHAHVVPNIIGNAACYVDEPTLLSRCT